jgi:tellurite resistance protein TehA-like permease
MYRVADGIYASCLVSGLFLWGLGLVWYILAMTITITHICRNRVYMSRASFSISWTAYTFPIGVWATASTQLATELDSTAFKVIATVISIQVVLQWAYVFIMFIWKAWNGTIFIAPELNQWEGGRPPLRFGKRAEDTMV